MSACLFTIPIKTIESMTISELKNLIDVADGYIKNPKGIFERDRASGQSMNKVWAEAILMAKENGIENPIAFCEREGMVTHPAIIMAYAKVAKYGRATIESSKIWASHD